MLKKYPDLYALLTEEADPRPSVEGIEKLARQIQAAHPDGTQAVLYKNGHWSLLVVGPREPVRSVKAASRRKFSDGRRPIAYCELKRSPS